MTVMATNTRELDIDTLVLTAYQYAGLMNEMQTAEGPQWDARSAYGRRQLELIVDALAADGIYERSMQTFEITVPMGQKSIQMPPDTVDVRGVTGNLLFDGSESPLEALSRTEYFEIPTKDQAGPPCKFYLARTAPMFLFLWPVPDEDVVVRVQRQRLTYDNSRGAATVDLERFWMDYLLHELATRLALGSGVAVERAVILQTKAAAAKEKAKGKASDQLPNQFVMAHRAPQWRCR